MTVNIAEFGRKNAVVSMLVVLLVAAQPHILTHALDGARAWLDGVLWATGVGVVGVGCRVLFPSRAAAWSLVFVGAWLAASVGLVQSVVTLLWFASAFCWGTVVLQACQKNTQIDRSPTEATLIGAVCLIAVWGVLLHFPVNYPSLYVSMLLAPVLYSARTPDFYGRCLRKTARTTDVWLRSIPFWPWLAGLALISWTLRWSSFPSVSWDDNAYHLRLWTELVTYHKAQFAVDQQIWSVAPFATDLLHAGLSIMSGGDTRGAMNLALAVLILLMMAQILHAMNVASRVQWLLMVLMASTPLIGAALLTLQTELSLALLGLAGLRLAMDADFGLRGRHVLGVLAACALCFAIKLTGLVLAVMILAYMGVRWLSPKVRQQAPAPYLRWPAFIVLVPLAVVALHSYVLAWIVTGNPVFPLYNGIFRSPLFPPHNFIDSRWLQGFGLESYVRAFFQTSKFLEAGDYSAGWQYLVLLPLSTIALLQRGVPNALRAMALPAFGFGVVVFSSVQYWRYLFPVMPIVGVLFAALFLGRNRLLQAVALVLILGCIIINYYNFTNITSIMDIPASAAANEGMREDLVRRYAPATLLTAKLNELATGARVLYPADVPFGATLHGTPLYVTWYAPDRAARFQGVTALEDMGTFLSQEAVDFAIISMSSTQPSGTPDSLLREYLARNGSVVMQEDNLLLYRVSAAPLPYRNVFRLSTVQAQPNAESTLILKPEVSGMVASPEGKVVAIFQTQGSRQALYSVRYACATDIGYLVAMIGWDKGRPYYRWVNCKSANTSFSEAVPVPLGARQGTLVIQTRDAQGAAIGDLSVDLQ